MGGARGDGAGSVRAGRRAVPDDVLPHLPSPRRGRLAPGGGGWSRALERGRSRATPSSRRDLERATAEQARIRTRLAAGRTGSDSGESLGWGIGGSRNPRQLKCLHAHVAFGLAVPGYVLGARILAEVDEPWPSTLLLRSSATAD